MIHKPHMTSYVLETSFLMTTISYMLPGTHALIAYVYIVFTHVFVIYSFLVYIR